MLRISNGLWTIALVGLLSAGVGCSAAESISETVTTPTGLGYVDIVLGTGKPVNKGDTVTVHYDGYLEDGKKFDSSRDRGKPFSVEIGIGHVIKGWDEGVVSMKVGGKRKLIIPPELAYGKRGAGAVIPPDSTLIFEIELLQVD